MALFRITSTKLVDSHQVSNALFKNVIFFFCEVQIIGDCEICKAKKKIKNLRQRGLNKKNLGLRPFFLIREMSEK